MSHQQTQGFLGQAQQGVQDYQQQLQGLQPNVQGFQDVTQQALGAFGDFNPLEAQQQLFQQQQQLMQPQQEQLRQSQEARLLSQGRLGSTGGGIQQQALEGAFQQQQQQALFNSFNQAQGAQQNLLGLAQGAFSPQLNFMTQQGQVPGMFQNLARSVPQEEHFSLGGMLGAAGGAFLGGVAGPIGSKIGASIGGNLFGGGGFGNPGDYSGMNVATNPLFTGPMQI